MTKIVDTIKDFGSSIILISESPWTPDVYDSNLLRHFTVNLSKGFQRSQAEKGRKTLIRFYQSFATDAQVRIYDPYLVLCPNTMCKYFSSGHRLYWNHDHIDVFASKMLASGLKSVISNLQSDALK